MECESGYVGAKVVSWHNDNYRSLIADIAGDHPEIDPRSPAFFRIFRARILSDAEIDRLDSALRYALVNGVNALLGKPPADEAGGGLDQLPGDDQKNGVQPAPTTNTHAGTQVEFSQQVSDGSDMGTPTPTPAHNPSLGPDVMTRASLRQARALFEMSFNGTRVRDMTGSEARKVGLATERNGRFLRYAADGVADSDVIGSCRTAEDMLVAWQRAWSEISATD